MQNETALKIINFKTLDSTNTWAKENFKKLDDSTIISADEQTKGKGRFKRVWVSENCENIYISFVLKPDKKDYLANLTQYLSVVTTKILKSYNVTPQIKWPNDVLVNGKKICGILCEAVSEKNEVTGVVLGIGVNLNTAQEILQNINKPATSLNLETGRKIDKNEFLKALCTEFFLHYPDLIEKGFEFIKEDYLNSINFLGKTVYIQQRDGEQRQEYTALDIDEKGNLTVKTPQGSVKTIYSGDLIY